MMLKEIEDSLANDPEFRDHVQDCREGLNGYSMRICSRCNGFNLLPLKEMSAFHSFVCLDCGAKERYTIAAIILNPSLYPKEAPKPNGIERARKIINGKT